MPDVRAETVAGITVIEVNADDATTLDPIWRQQFAAVCRSIQAPWWQVGPGHCAARVPADQADQLLALAAELAPTRAAAG
jgi:hypothetical protein